MKTGAAGAGVAAGVGVAADDPNEGAAFVPNGLLPPFLPKPPTLGAGNALAGAPNNGATGVVAA